METHADTDIDPETPPTPAGAIDQGPKKRGRKPEGDKPADKDEKLEHKLEAKPDEGEGEVRDQGPRVTATIREMRADEEKAIKDMVDELGPDGSFKIVIGRSEPPEVRDPSTGKMINCKGHLETMTRKPTDLEEYLARRHGGGLYHIKFLQRDEKGRMNIKAHRYVGIAGDPTIDNLPRSTMPMQPMTGGGSGGSGESEGVVKKAMDILSDQIAAMRNGDGGKASGEVAHLFDFLKQTISNKDSELAAIRAEMASIRNAPKADDSFKETMIQTFVKDDGARTQSIRLAYEAEIRALKEGFEQDRNRLADRHERELKEINSRHERDTDRLIAAKNAEIAAIKGANDMAGAAMKIAQETQVTVYKSEIGKLERDLKDTRDDLRVMKDRKDKSLIEQAKELKTIKEALSDDDGDDDEDKSNFQKIIESLPSVPAAIQAARGMMGGQPAAAPPAAQAPVQSKKQILKDPATGKRFTIVNVGGKPQLHELKPKEVAPPPGPTGPSGQQLPPVDPAQVKMAISFLETSYTNNTEPNIIAQSAKMHMSEGMLVAIRELGVEQFLIRVGGVPMSSPLLGTLKGKNWVRQVGASLIGEAP